MEAATASVAGLMLPMTGSGLRQCLASHAGRQRVAAAAGTLARVSGSPVTIEDPSVGGVRLIVEPRHDGPSRLTVELGARAPLHTMPPPAYRVLQPDGNPFVATRAERDIDLEYADDSLILPRMAGAPAQDRPWGYVARTIALDAADDDPLGARFVEPGVGRSYLLDFVGFEDRPEYLDFSVTGAGQTPYSAGGMLAVGNHEDGYVPLVRACHRHRMSRVIESGGGRVPRTGAIINLRNHCRRGARGEQIPVALLIRGFRSVLRVKQLDPMASVMLSRPRWGAVQEQLRAEAGRDLEMPPSAGACQCLTPSIVLGCYPGRVCSQERTCNVLRRRHIANAAPAMLLGARARLANELCGESTADAVPAGAYAQWFSRTLGEQLGVLANLRVLHDYRAVLATVPDPREGGGFNSLGDTNVTLAAELPDLDTAVLVDDDDGYNHDVFGLSTSQQQTLRSRFGALHAREVAVARGVTRALAVVALPDDQAAQGFAGHAFDQGYLMATGRSAP